MIIEDTMNKSGASTTKSRMGDFMAVDDFPDTDGNGNLLKNADDGNVIQGILADFDQNRLEIFQRSMEIEEKKQKMAALKTERQQLQAERAQFHQELHERNVKLGQAREQSKELRQKSAACKEKASKVERKKNQLEFRMESVGNTMQERLRARKVVAQRLAKARLDAVRLRDTVREQLDKGKQQLSVAENELENWHQENQAEVMDRRKDWNETRDALDAIRDHSNAIIRDTKLNQQQLQEMKKQMDDNGRQMLEFNRNTDGFKLRLDFEKDFLKRAEDVAALRRDFEVAQNELERMQVCIQAKVIEVRMQREKEEKLLDKERSELTEAEEKRESDKRMHEEKIDALAKTLQERLRSLEKAEREFEVQQSARKNEWAEIEAQNQKTVNAQQSRMDESKQQLESLAGETVDLEKFSVGCQQIADIRIRFKEERQRLTAEIDALKKEAKERAIAELRRMAEPLSPQKCFSQPQAQTDFDFLEKPDEPRPRKADGKHVTFKNTPVVWEDFGSIQSQRSDIAPPTNKGTPVKEGSLLFPIKPNPAIAKTPSPRKQIFSSSKVAALKSVSGKKSVASASQYSDSSDESMAANPHSQAFLRKPPPTGRSTKSSRLDLLKLF